MSEQDPTLESTGLNYLDDEELRRHVRIMLEGTGHRGPLSWPMDNLDDEIYEEIERRVPALAALREQQDALLEADLERRRVADPTTPNVGDYADSGQEWDDPEAEREWEALRDRWRSDMTAWLRGS